ncbi:MAG: TolC family protein [Gemmata sp.]
MQVPPRTHRLATRIVAGVVPLSVIIGATVSAQQPPPVTPPLPLYSSVNSQNPLPAPAPLPRQPADKNGAGDDKSADPADRYPETGPELSLGECITVALERQPSLRAVKESTAATEIGYKALTNFGTASTLISPDLEIRKQQAKRGLMATSAEYQKLHNEVVHDATRLYYTAVYAKQQAQLADRVVARLGLLVEIGRETLRSTPAKELEGFNLLKLQMMENGLFEARKLQLSARVGRQKALSGLREVMAVDDRTFPFQIKDKELPVMSQKAALAKERVAELTLERRPELVLAAAGVDAFRLEVYAQGKIPFRRVAPTLAQGADIHAKEIPATTRSGTDYRPGGIIPEMPTQLVGSKYDRVCRAMAFARRAEAVYDKAHNLILVEAENAFLDFDLASQRLSIAQQQFKLSKEMQEQARAVAEITKAKDQLVQAEVAAAKAQSDYVEAVYTYLMSLAALERVTAGGIRPSFPDR